MAHQPPDPLPSTNAPPRGAAPVVVSGPGPPPPRPPAGPSADAEDDDEETTELLRRPDFVMYCLKVLPCAKQHRHHWTTCPWAHPGERACRRDPRTHAYNSVVCQDLLQTGRCPCGDACTAAHSVFEYHLHPQRYRTQMCREGPGCQRRICFFAHAEAELREISLPPEVAAAGEAAAEAFTHMGKYSLSALPAAARLARSVSLPAPGPAALAALASAADDRRRSASASAAAAAAPAGDLAPPRGRDRWVVDSARPAGAPGGPHLSSLSEPLGAVPAPNVPALACQALGVEAQPQRQAQAALASPAADGAVSDLPCAWSAISPGPCPAATALNGSGGSGASTACSMGSLWQQLSMESCRGASASASLGGGSHPLLRLDSADGSTRSLDGCTGGFNAPAASAAAAPRPPLPCCVALPFAAPQQLQRLGTSGAADGGGAQVQGALAELLEACRADAANSMQQAVLAQAAASAADSRLQACMAALGLLAQAPGQALSGPAPAGLAGTASGVLFGQPAPSLGAASPYNRLAQQPVLQSPQWAGSAPLQYCLAPEQQLQPRQGPPTTAPLVFVQLGPGHSSSAVLQQQQQQPGQQVLLLLDD